MKRKFGEQPMPDIANLLPGANLDGESVALQSEYHPTGNRLRMKIDTEQVFGEVVLAAGGRRLDEELQGKADFQNADYLFEQHNCVGELKRIQKFLDKDRVFCRKLGERYSKWASQGRVPMTPTGQQFAEFNLASIPRDCAEEVMSLLCKQLMNAYLRKANQQLRETKKRYSMPDAYGIVFLAVEGTSWYDPQGLVTVLARIPPGRLDAVDAFVVFNSNYEAGHAGHQGPVSFWVSARYSPRPLIRKLTERLSFLWEQQLAKRCEGWMATYCTPQGVLGHIKFPSGK